jgi:hypothetical protein
MRGRDQMEEKEQGSPNRKTNKGEPTFYDKVLIEAEKLDFEDMSGVEGIDEEITILRVKVKSILVNRPNDTKLLMEVTNLIGRLAKIRYSMTSAQKKGLKEAIGNVLRDVAVPLGISVINKKL